VLKITERKIVKKAYDRKRGITLERIRKKI
jgi:hypothetical protein